MARLRSIGPRPAVSAPCFARFRPRACSPSPCASSPDSRRRSRVAISSQFDRSAVVARASGDDDDASTSSPSWRTCRHCKRRFDPNDNPPTACRRHPALFTGGEVSKAIGFCREGQGPENSLKAVIGQTGLVRFFDCCGGDESSPGCVLGPHEPF